MRSLLITVLLLSACGKNNQPPPPSSGSPNAQPESGPSRPRAANPPAQPGQPQVAQTSQAARMFGSMCAMCHGPDGTGRGPAAANLNPKPRDYTDAAWQASVTDEALKEIIVKGGQALGKSPMMPPQPQLADTPEVLDGLVQIIRGFGKQP